MHINFVEKKSVQWNVESLKGLLRIRSFSLTRKTMMIIIAGTFGLMGLFEGFQGLRMHFLQKKLEKVAAEQAALRSQLGDADLKMLETQGRNLALEAYSHRILWSEIFNQVASQIPPRLWLKALQKQPEKKGLLIRAEASEQSVAAQFLRALQDTHFFQQVNLISSDKMGAEGSYRVDLKMECALK